jgi:hypothetical protein
MACLKPPCHLIYIRTLLQYKFVKPLKINFDLDIITHSTILYIQSGFVYY